MLMLMLPTQDGVLLLASIFHTCTKLHAVMAAGLLVVQVKNLLLPWQWGLKYFWDVQMDADLECDALGWQYVSGGMAGGCGSF